MPGSKSFESNRMQLMAKFRPKLAKSNVILFVLCFVTAIFAHCQTGNPASSGSYPRIGNAWWGEYVFTNNPSQADQVQLFLGPNFDPNAASSVQAADPNAPMLLTVNAMETVAGIPAVPDSYFLLDTNGNKICNWPGNPPDYILNLTNPAVAQFVGQYAAQVLAQSSVKYNGVFFDNLEATIASKTSDCYGNPIQISSLGNGVADNPANLNAAWSAGIYSVLSTFRSQAPNAYITMHGNQMPPDPRALQELNGDAFVFDVPDIREGTLAFGNLWDAYQDWFTSGQAPVLTAIQSSPPNQIAYGYGYTPAITALPQTAGFGQTFYPNMRFGLATTLMNDGFFIFDFGDVSSPVSWWYDEYNFNLGQAAAPAQQLGTPASSNMLSNGSFESGLTSWNFSVSNDGLAAATVSVDNSTAESGQNSVHVDVTSPGTQTYHIDLEQDGLSLIAGSEYQVSFWAKSDIPLQVGVGMQGGSPSYANYGLNTAVAVVTGWNHYSVSFTSNATASDGRLEFCMGGLPGNIWLDNVQLVSSPERMYRRDFTGGVVLLNGTTTPQTFTLEPGFNRFTGSQAPLYQYVVDDNSSAFTATGAWIVDTLDTGWRKTSGPYYHAWNTTLHELDPATGSAQWNLGIPADGSYTIQVWLPAAPASSTWTSNAVYSVVANGSTLATIPLNQSAAAQGDQWFNLGTFSLTAASNPVLQVQNGGSGPLIADAVYVFSATAKYNDGSVASQVTVPAMDGILLQRQTPTQSISFPAPANQIVGNSMTLEATASSGMTVNYLSNTPSVCEVAGETATFSTVGVCSITASQPGGSGYTAAIPVTESFSVQNSQTILLSNPETAVLGAGSLTIVANASSGLAVTLTAATPSMCSVSGSVLTPKAAGVCTVNASQPGNATYAAAATATASVNVLAPQSIAFPSLPIQGLGGLPFTVSATASSGLAVSFSSQSPAVCSVSGNLVTLLSLGSCSIAADQAGGPLFAAAAEVVQSFTVVPNLLTNGGFEGSMLPWAFNLTGVTPGVDKAALSTSQHMDGSSSVNVDVTQTTAQSYYIDLEQGHLPVIAGSSYTVQFWALADSAHTMQIQLQGGSPAYAQYGFFQSVKVGTSWQLYQFSFTSPVTATDGRLEFHFGSSTGNVWLDDVQLYGTASIPQTITFPAPANVLFATTNVSLAATANSGLPLTYISNTPAVCSMNGPQVITNGVGTCSVTASQAGNSAYQAATSVSQTFQVMIAPQSIVFPALANITYSAAPVFLSSTASSGLAVNLVSTTPAVCSVTGSQASPVAAGVCSITASQSGNANYSAAPPAAQSFVIAPLVQSIAFPPIANQGLGGLPLTVSAQASSGLGVAFVSNSLSVCSASGNAVSLLAPGTCSINATQAGNSIYAAAPSVTQSFNVVANELSNGGFESGSRAPWKFNVVEDGAVNATAAIDPANAAAGTVSAMVTILSAATANWHVDLEQDGLGINAGKHYVVQFWASPSAARTIQVVAQGGSPLFANYGINTLVSLTPGWKLYQLNFIALATASDCRLEFDMGSTAGTVWLDEVQFYPVN